MRGGREEYKSIPCTDWFTPTLPSQHLFLCTHTVLDLLLEAYFSRLKRLGCKIWNDITEAFCNKSKTPLKNVFRKDYCNNQISYSSELIIIIIILLLLLLAHEDIYVAGHTLIWDLTLLHSLLLTSYYYYCCVSCYLSHT